jgi:spore maturation protein CgeB
MKVRIVGSKGFDGLEYHLNDAFVFLGHDCAIIDITNAPPNVTSSKIQYYLRRFNSTFDEYMHEQLAKRVIADKPDLVICTYRFLHPLLVTRLKAALKGVPIVQINPDAITSFESQQIFASDYDFYFTKDPFIVRFMRDKMKLNTHYFPECFNARMHQRPNESRVVMEEKINLEVMVFGNMYPYRVRMIEQLVRAGLNVTLFGLIHKSFPPHLRHLFTSKDIRGQEKADIVYGSKIVFNNFHYAEIECVNCKFFEIMGIGGFQICDYKPTVEEYSSVDPELFTFNKIEQAIDLMQHYRDKPELRHQIADQQHAHFQLHHTYEHRVKQVLDTVFAH